MLLPELHLSHVIKGEILTGPSTNKDILDTLLRESMVRHGFQRLFICSNLENAALRSMIMTRGIFMVMVVMMMAIMTIRPRIMRRVRQEIDDQEDPARLQPRREPLRRQIRVVEVVEAEPDHREVEAGELAVAEGLRVLVLRNAEIAVEGGHLIFGKALAMAVSGRKEAWLLEVTSLFARVDSQRRFWESDKSLPGFEPVHCTRLPSSQKGQCPRIASCMAQRPVSPELVSLRSSENEQDKQKQPCDHLKIPKLLSIHPKFKKRTRTDPRHRTGATGIIEDPHGPPGNRVGGADALLVGAVVLLEPFDADQAPARLEPPAYLGRCLLVLCIVVCCFIANVVLGSALTNAIVLDQRALADYFWGQL